MNDRVYEDTRWSGGTGVMRRLHGAGHHLTRLLAGWRDSATDGFGEDVAQQAVTQETREGRARVRLEALARQEEIKLVQRIFLGPGSRRRAVLIAGVERDNGCAQICIRAGETLARLTPQSVCVVDANVRSPAQHRRVGADACDGLATAVGRPDAAPTFAQRLTPDNLWLLPWGSASDPDLQLTADRVQPCLQELGAHFDHLIISIPPVDLYAESLALGQCVDGVLLVLEANVTRRETVRHVKTRLEDLDVPLLGVVLNNRTFPIPEALYRRL
jgi:Mrp family chromosome partitioning ATPase